MLLPITHTHTATHTTHTYHYIPNVGVSDCKESIHNAGALGSIPGWGRSLEGGNNNPLYYSCLENPMDRGAWRATIHGVTKSWTQLRNWHVHKNKRGKLPWQFTFGKGCIREQYCFPMYCLAGTARTSCSAN